MLRICSRLRPTTASEIADAQQSTRARLPREFNLGSPKQLQEIPLANVGFLRRRRLRRVSPLDADALQWLAEVGDDPLPRPPAMARSHKLRQTVAGHQCSRMRTTASTRPFSRRRSLRPGASAARIPTRTFPSGRRRVAAFGQASSWARGYEALLTADYSRSRCGSRPTCPVTTKLIETFVSGEDLHSTMAAEVRRRTAGR